MTTDLNYTPSSRLNLRYDLGATDSAYRFRDDKVIADTTVYSNVDTIFHTIGELSISEDWQDRVRAEALREAAYRRITLPDHFPCIYDANTTHEPARVWVVSADSDMLETLLPLYRELWDAYNSQWPEQPAERRRDFVFGYLDGISPRGMYRPGVTAEQVIGDTMLTHEGMYRLAPEHLRVMHPLHPQWMEQRQKQLHKDAKKTADSES